MQRTIIQDVSALILILILLFFIRNPYLKTFLCFSAILIYAYNKRGIKEELGFSRPKSINITLINSFLLALGIVLLSYFVFLPLIQKLTGQELELGPFNQVKNNPRILILSLVMGWIIGGLFEETIFRGFMLSRFMNHLPAKMGTIIGILISSFVFGYLHLYQGPTGQILTGIVGMMLAIIYVVNKRNLWLVILTHCFIDTLSLTILYFDIIKI